MKSKKVSLLCLLVAVALCFGAFSALPFASASGLALDGSQAQSLQTGSASLSVTGLTTTSTGDYVVVLGQMSNDGGDRWLGNYTVSSVTDSDHFITWQPSARLTFTNLCPSAYGNSTIFEWYGLEQGAHTIPNTDAFRINFTSSSGSNQIDMAVHIFGVAGSGGFDGNSGLPFHAKACNTAFTTPTVSGVSTTSSNDFVFAASIGFSSGTPTPGTIGSLSATTIRSGSLVGITEYTIQGAPLSSTSCTATNSGSIQTQYWTIFCDALTAAGSTSSSSSTGTFVSQCPSGEFAYNFTVQSGVRCSSISNGGSSPSSCTPELGYVCQTSSSSSTSSAQSGTQENQQTYPNGGGPVPPSSLPEYTFPVAIFFLVLLISGAFAYGDYRKKHTGPGLLGRSPRFKKLRMKVSGVFR